MKHTITKLDENGNFFELSFSDGWEGKKTEISLKTYSVPFPEYDQVSIISTLFTKEDLHSIIGILLHLQAKLK